MDCFPYVFWPWRMELSLVIPKFIGTLLRGGVGVGARVWPLP